MATTTTYSLEKPTVGGSENTWGTDWNDNADKIDDLLDGTTAIKPNLDEGLWEVGGVAVTATAAELNILDGVTASTAELNILDGVTATTAELNILDGVTATAAELNILDGVTATTAELNYVDGVTSNIQTQLNGKQASLGFTPVQQGGGSGQLTNKVYIGWTGGGLKAQVDSTDLGFIHTSGLAAGDVGTYAWGGQLAGSYGFGTLVAGSSIVLGAFAHESYRDAGAAANSYGHGQTLSGTWRCMGRADIATAGRYSATLWLRVS